MPLLLFAGVVALLPFAQLLRGDGNAMPSRTVPGPRLLGAFGTAIAVFAAVWLAWVVLWRIEQRW